MSGYSAPRPIGHDDVVADFACGEASLDDYLKRRALANHVNGASRCFVTCRDGRVVGYYALASASLERADSPGRIRRNMPDPIPVILLSRLAVDSAAQGAGLDAQLLRDATIRVVAAAENIGVRAFVVHALNDRARRFYAQFDFEPSPTDPQHMLLLVNDGRASISRNT